MNSASSLAITMDFVFIFHCGTNAVKLRPLESCMLMLPPELSPDKVLEWVDQCDFALAELLPYQGVLTEYPDFHRDQIGVLGALATAAVRASGTALVLLENQKIWDADIITRSVVEASLKFAHLLYKPAEFAGRYIEYAEMLPDIADLKNHQKAMAVNEVLEKTDNIPHPAFQDLLLSQEEYDALNAKYSSKIKRELESKWSFSGLLASIEQEPGPHAELCKGLGHNYSMSSRFLHADWHGVHTILERDSREEPSRTATHVVHASRIISDIYWFTILRLLKAYDFVGKSKEPINELMKRHEPFLADMNKSYEAWLKLEYPERVSSCSFLF